MIAKPASQIVVRVRHMFHFCFTREVSSLTNNVRVPAGLCKASQARAGALREGIGSVLVSRNAPQSALLVVPSSNSPSV